MTQISNLNMSLPATHKQLLVLSKHIVRLNSLAQFTISRSVKLSILEHFHQTVSDWSQFQLFSKSITRSFHIIMQLRAKINLMKLLQNKPFLRRKKKLWSPPLKRNKSNALWSYQRGLKRFQSRCQKVARLNYLPNPVRKLKNSPRFHKKSL